MQNLSDIGKQVMGKLEQATNAVANPVPTSHGSTLTTIAG